MKKALIFISLFLAQIFFASVSQSQEPVKKYKIKKEHKSNLQHQQSQQQKLISEKQELLKLQEELNSLIQENEKRIQLLEQNNQKQPNLTKNNIKNKNNNSNIQNSSPNSSDSQKTQQLPAPTQNSKKEAPQNLIAVKNVFKFMGNKTQGHQLTINAIRTDSQFDAKYKNANDNTIYAIENGTRKENNILGAGVDYGYAFNKAGFFFTPSVFFEQNQFGAKSNEGTDGARFRVNNRFGIKANFGYDINEFFSPYVTFGHARIDYTAKGIGRNQLDTMWLSKNNRGHNSSNFYGAGLKFNLNHNFAFNFEYNRQKLTGDAGVPDESLDYIANNYFDSEIDLYKLGLVYSF